MSVTDQLLQNSENYAATFEKGELPMPPGQRACMDARLNPYGILGLAEGDAHIIRNAGGVVTEDTDAIRGFVYDVHTGRLEEVV